MYWVRQGPDVDMKLGVSGHSNYHTVHVLPNALHGLGPLGHVIHVHTDSTYLTERGPCLLVAQKLGGTLLGPGEGIVLGRHATQTKCVGAPRAIYSRILSGLCLCKRAAKIGPGSPRTKHMSEYCRGLTAHVIHSSLRCPSLDPGLRACLLCPCKIASTCFCCYG